ncbi:MAG TPA: PAS domain S-box protein [Azospirillum sp.]|nr:PAS domain S-box protein [Azospirillum sp.]
MRHPLSATEPPWPLNELARITKLKGYCILDTPPDPVFDRLTQLAIRHFRMPTVLVSLVDENRQWFKSRYGFEAPHVPRRLAFCAYAILVDEVMVVHDATRDERFADNDLVTGPPFIRFYAGAPLRTPEGLLLGTFCVIDHQPHPEFSEEARRDLEEFARIVMHELEIQAARRGAEAARQAEAEARAAAEQAEARYRAVVETAVDAMVVIDEQGVMQSFNTAAERIFGYAAADAIGRDVSLLMPEPDASRHMQYIDHYLRTGERRIIGIGREVEGRHRDGRTFPLELSIAEWRVGGRRYFTGIMRDVSRRKAAERALRQGHALFEGVLESTTDPIFVKNPDGRYVAVNSATAKALGRTREEVVGRADAELLPADAAARIRATDRRIMTTGRSETIEEYIPTAGIDGPRAFSTAKTPLRDADGTIIGLVGVARDVTGRKRTEEALRASEERFRALVENAPQLMWVNRPNGVAEFFNLAWRTYTGQETVEGTRWDPVHPDDRERVQDLRERAIAAGEPYEYELRLRRADGVHRWHICRVSPLRQDGRIVAWVGTAMDVDDIRRARELAEEANRSKSRFLASASHDLRQPMQSILLFAEVLRGHVPDPAGRDTLDRLQQGLDALKGLLDGLLDVSRLDADIVQPQFEDVPVGEIIGPLAAAYMPIAQAKGLAWRVGPCDALVRSDRVLLGRMLRNLIENAIRYTPKGTVALACTVKGEWLRIEVRDTGIGIQPDQLGRIFEEFYQVGNPERDRALGLGLGLAIVRRLSVLLDHPVRAWSRPGGGSVFTVEVPLAAGPPRAAVPPPAASVPPDPATGSERFAVAVDDDIIVLLALKSMLQEWGYEVLTAASTDEAVERLRAAGRRPDIVLADYRLREGRVGTEAVVRIREMCGADVPGIIVTGEIGPEPQTDAVRHGLGLLHKPVTPRLLEAALARYRQETLPR